MQKFTDLSETPFIDLRNKKNVTNYSVESQLPFQNLPTNQEQIQYKIHKNFTKYDEKPYLIADQENQKIINEIIKAVREEFRMGLDIQTSKKFKQLSLKYVDTVVKYLKQDNPQAAFIALRAQSYDKKYSISVDKLKQIAKKTQYPLLLSQVQSILISSPNKKQISLGLEYLDKIVKGGLPQGFLWKGLFQTKLGEGNKAYEMFKNAQKLGYEPVAYKYLGQLFMGKNLLMTANLKLAEKYFIKAKQSGAYMEPQILYQIKQIQIQKQKQKIKFNSIKSTQDTQSVQLSNFISNKIRELKNPQLLKNMYSFGMTNNTTNPQSVASFNEPKTFYVVFSPLMSFPGRHFLVKDINGSLEYISIYNWDLVPIEKLKMLHQTGTKIILNDYIRKVGAGDNLPLYRVDNPFSVQFYKRTQKHTISDKQFRNFAKNLFQRNLLDKAMTIYEYMIMKGSQQMQIIYSNMGVIFQRQKNTPQAIKCYQSSLKIKKFNKSQVRLVNIYIRGKQIDKAQKIIKDIQSFSERQELQKQIQKLKEKQNDASDFTKSVRNKHKVKKQLFNLTQDPFFKMNNSNPTSMLNIREDKWHLLYNKQKFEQGLNVKGLAQQRFFDLIQLVYNSVQNKNLTKQIVQNFYKMSEVAFKIMFKNQRYPYSASYLAFVMPLILNSRKFGLSHQVNTVHYMAQRLNYLQNRIEDICLQLQQKGRYKQAEEIYRFSGNYCTPFNVKVAEMLFLQSKFDQCQKYCQKTIESLRSFPLQKFLKYIAGLVVWQLKSLIRLNKYEKVVIKGEQYIKQFQKKCPKLIYEDQTFRKGIMSFKPSKSKDIKEIPDFQEVKQQISATQLIQDIYRQIVRAFISMKQITKAREYFVKVQLKKQNCNYAQLIDQYYQTRVLQLLIIKMQNPSKAIKEIDNIQKQINNDKKLQNKQPYIKFLMKQKLSLLIESQKIPQAIKQSQEIVKINNINYIFVKNKLFSFIKRNPSKTIELLDKIKSSDTLNCLYTQLYERSKNFLKKYSDSKQVQKQIENILLLLQKLDIKQEPQDEEDEIYEQQSIQSSETSSFHSGNSDEKSSDFHDELYQDEYDHQICRFQGKNGITYIVIFEQSLKNILEVADYHRFVCAADHLCRREYGSTGIKITGSEIRLKIRKSTRLTGKLIESPADPKVRFCFFNKRQKHDDYKRHNNK